MHIALNKLKKMNFNLKSGKQLKTSYNISQTPVETISDAGLIAEVPLADMKKINGNQKQASLQRYFQKSTINKEKKRIATEIKISQSFPVKFGVRKKLQRDKIPFEVVKSIIHLNLLDRVIIPFKKNYFIKQKIPPNSFDLRFR
jgi:hypothetical protein